MSKVNSSISDLFFELHHEGTYNRKGNFTGFTNLEAEAAFLLAELKNLGVDNLPTKEEIVTDFMERF